MAETKEKKKKNSAGRGKKDPCWSGYKAHGSKKTKAGKTVPNCKPA